MTESLDTLFQDPTTAPFWEGARRGELLIQRCLECGQHQFYPRPFCLTCQSDNITWVAAVGTGIVYSQTTTRLEVLPDMPPPYVVALVELDEGPRLLTNIVDGETAIGERVRVVWRQRSAEPPLPVFTPFGSS